MPPRVKKEQTCEFVELTADQAVELLGIREAKEDDGKCYSYVNANGVKGKFAMDKNHENRPFSLSLANDYKDALLKGEFSGQWNSASSTCNGESCVLDWNGNVVSMAHRGVGLWLAEQERQRLDSLVDGPDSPAQQQLDEYGCNGAITLPTLLVKGVDPACADTSDTGKNRTLSDVIFRSEDVPADWTESDAKKYATILSTAIKHLHGRINGYRIVGTPKLHNAVGKRFLEKHPLIKDIALYVMAEGKGDSDRKRPLDRYQVKLGLIAAHIYLQMYSGSNVKKYWKDELKMDRVPSKDLRDLGEEFWLHFGQIDNNGKKSTPPAVWTLKMVLDESDKGQKPLSRDGLCTAVTRAMLAYGESKTADVTTNALRKGLINAKGEDNWVSEYERFGGLDQERDSLFEMGLIEEIEVIGAETSGDWKKEDTTWVYPGPGFEIWYGVIKGFSTDRTTADVYSKDDDVVYEGVPVTDLYIDKPEEAEAEVEEEEAVAAE